MVLDSEILDDLLESAADATEQPRSPKGGIPRQFLPKILRNALRCFVLPFVLVDYGMQRVAKWIIRPPYKRVGACKRRGNCCHYILIAKSRTLMGRLFHFWYTQVNGFYPRMKEASIYEGKEMYVMGCRHLKKDGSCGSYRLRPMICRQWPVIEHFGVPKVLKGCGFEVKERQKKKPASGHPKLNILN